MNDSPRLLLINDKECLNAGGKAANLYKLTQASLTIPPACVLTGTSEKMDRALIRKAWETLDCPSVAARSSAGDEDGENSSAAGQYESVLGIDSPEKLAEGVESCTASLYSTRASAYRNSETPGAVMNVVVQKMINPVFAGVVFTDDPLDPSGDRMIVETVEGAGENLVSGRKAAARISLNRKGTVEEIENPENQALPGEREMAALFTEASRFAAAEGCPQDLEWCIDGEGRLYWLQARPITTEKLPAADEFDYTVRSEDEIFTRCNIGEMIPGAVTPLTRDCFAPAIEHAMRVLYSSCGGIHKGNRDRPFVVSFSNHLLFNFTSIYGMAGRIAGAGKENIEMNILGKTIDDPLPHPEAPGVIKIINALRYFSTMGRHKGYLKKLIKLKDSIHFSGSDDPVSALKEWTAKLPLMDRGYALHMLVSGHSGFANSLLTNILERSNPELEVNDSLLSHLLSRVDGVESAKAVAQLERISEEIFKNPDLLKTFQSADNRAALEELSSSPGTEGELYRAFMERHGHRCIREAEFRSLAWEEDQEPIIGNLKEMLKIREKGLEKPEPPPFPLDNFLKGFPKGPARNSVAWALNKSRRAVRERELSKSLSIRIQFFFKKELRRIAALMVSRDLLPEADLVYFLTRSELSALAEGGRQDLVRKAGIRRRLLGEQAQAEFPELWRGTVPERTEKEDYDPAKTIQGTPVSVGRIRGRVRIVRTAADAGLLEQGEIMVAPLTDIGWTPFYSIAGGMITEIGSALSHGSVIAREYGLPLVTNISSACDFLEDGTEIELDGKEGTVRILDAV
ncbi:MAG: PEP/pyruvate-binding domain-containing protein [Spirochaetales bacterium]|nr:PEP/pyruvate-binding domain-containing protein [Spirochaetales bacterium]